MPMGWVRRILTPHGLFPNEFPQGALIKGNFAVGARKRPENPSDIVPFSTATQITYIIVNVLKIASLN